MKRTVEEINRRIDKGEAIVLTAREVEQLIGEGRDKEAREVDVVTTGTMGLMSGTYALLSFPVAEAGHHRRFVAAHVNGVPMSVGPCPNENLGILDGLVFGPSTSPTEPHYGGGHLFRDLVEGEQVTVEAVADDGRTVGATLGLEDMPFARLMSSRNLFRNYRAFVNPSDQEVRSIFHCLPFPPNFGGLTFSGCGHLNPLQNDPQLRCIGVGTRVLFNGSEGFVTGAGTRSTTKHPNLMTVADMRTMDPALMGGFLTAEGPECITTYGVPIPVLDDSVLKDVLTMDDRIPLSVVDVRDRHTLSVTDYGQAWRADEVVASDRDACVRCAECAAGRSCPTRAIGFAGGELTVDRTRCFNCGACIATCEQGCFRASMGEVKLEIDGEARSLPIIGRGSNREGALRTMNDLKNRVLDGSFVITRKVADIRP